MKSDNVYILSIEAAHIWEHMHRERKIERNYIGMLPVSLALEELENGGLKKFDSKRYNKTLTNDIINVKFNQKVRSSQESIKALQKKINGENDEKIESIINDLINKNYEEIKIQDTVEKNTGKVIVGLRTLLYKNGFVLREVNEKTGEVKEMEYVVYKRSAAKSRTSQVLFIKKDLKSKMLKWARLGINFEGVDDVDYPSLLAYESLVDSSIENLIHIDTKNILLVSDVKSVFCWDVNVVKKDEEGLLESVPVDEYIIESDIFDGEGLLDSSYFANDKSMMLLRQHMFKCCVFNANIQQFLKDNCPYGQDFETWELKDMFSNPILAKDVHMITTPNSLKALKFYKKKKSKKEMYRHWKKKVEKENCLFGVCKQDKGSKLGYDEEGNILQQTSYQMINSMPFSYEDMKELSTFEVEYIEKLKNDDSTYIEYLTRNADDMNSNNMWVDLYKINSKISYTKEFKNKRKKDIHNYVKRCKKGKIRVNGDYCTILQNGKELLYHSIGKLPIAKDGILDYDSWNSEMILKDNQVFTTLHPFGAEYVGFRNPHTSPSNVLIVENKDSEFIRTYFDLSNNIIYTNAINFPINRILNGQDVDSDSLLVFNNSKMLEIARKCYGYYRVCVNGVNKDSNRYKVDSSDMAKIDNILADSQKYIGRVVNLGQLYMSKYWNMIAKGETDVNRIKRALKAVDICTILSEISIDMAKKLFDIEIEEQIRYLAKDELLDGSVPCFFVDVSENKNISNRTKRHDTSVDYLHCILDALDNANAKKTTNITKLLKGRDVSKAKKKQLDSIVNVINNMNDKIKRIEAKYRDCNNDKKKEKFNLINDSIVESMRIVGRYKITDVNMYALIYRVFTSNKKLQIDCKYKIDFLNALYRVNRSAFLNIFKKQNALIQ